MGKAEGAERGILGGRTGGYARAGGHGARPGLGGMRCTPWRCLEGRGCAPRGFGGTSIPGLAQRGRGCCGGCSSLGGGRAGWDRTRASRQHNLYIIRSGSFQKYFFVCVCVCAAVLKRPPGSRGEPCIERRAGAQGRRRRRREGLRGHRAPQGPGPPDPPPGPAPRRQPGPCWPCLEPQGLPRSPGAAPEPARPPGRCGRSRGRAAALGGCELFPAENERSPRGVGQMLLNPSRPSPSRVCVEERKGAVSLPLLVCGA